MDDDKNGQLCNDRESYYPYASIYINRAIMLESFIASLCALIESDIHGYYLQDTIRVVSE